MRGVRLRPFQIGGRRRRRVGGVRSVRPTLIYLCEDYARILHKYHPHTKIFVGNQKLDNAGDRAIFEYLQAKPRDWIDGLVYGPGSNAMGWTPGRRQDHRMDLFRGGGGRPERLSARNAAPVAAAAVDSAVYRFDALGLFAVRPDGPRADSRIATITCPRNGTRGCTNASRARVGTGLQPPHVPRAAAKLLPRLSGDGRIRDRRRRVF